MREARLIGYISPITPPRLLPCPWVDYRGRTDPSVNNFFSTSATHCTEPSARAETDRQRRTGRKLLLSTVYRFPSPDPPKAGGKVCARLAANKPLQMSTTFFQKALDNPARLCYYDLGSAVSLARNFVPAIRNSCTVDQACPIWRDRSRVAAARKGVCILFRG